MNECHRERREWEVRDEYDVYESGTLGIVAAVWGPPMPTMEEVNAHRRRRAHLIATAPKLLAACRAAYKKLMDVHDGEDKDNPLPTMLREAIEKAEGGS